MGKLFVFMRKDNTKNMLYRISEQMEQNVIFVRMQQWISSIIFFCTNVTQWVSIIVLLYECNTVGKLYRIHVLN
jgi:hypothetical protein